jgi:uncharacterized protein GlcG (DUF336 family)/ferredoxin
MYKVKVTVKDESHEYSCQDFDNALSAARKNFIPLPSGCRRGGCGMCKVKVIDGEYDHELLRSKEALSDEELNNRYALACLMYPKSDVQLLVGEEEQNISLETEELVLPKTSSSVLYEKPVLTQHLTTKIIDAVCMKAKELDILINVAVVDDGANLKGFLRMDEAPLLSGSIAQNKAYTAASFGLPTHEWYPMIKDEPALLHGIVHTEKLVVFGGGIPIKCEGYIIGGIGVSGGSAEQDVLCAQAGLNIVHSLVNNNKK